MTGEEDSDGQRKVGMAEEAADGLLGLPELISAKAAFAAATEVGKFFRQLPAGPRDRIEVMLRNKARLFAQQPEGVVSALLLLTVISNSSNFSGDDSRLLANLVIELQRVK